MIGDNLGLEGGLWSVVGGLNDNLGNFGFAAAQARFPASGEQAGRVWRTHQERDREVGQGRARRAPADRIALSRVRSYPSAT